MVYLSYPTTQMCSYSCYIIMSSKQKLTGVVTVESPVKDRVTIDIKVTAIEHRNIIPDLLAAHALSGCDTTACYFGISKGTIVNT